ncbi:MAG: zinc ABC transporter substrate-binding protein [Candidatus Babeliales bacterium]
MRVIRYLFLLITFLLLFVIRVVRQSYAASNNAPKKITVVCTTSLIADAVQQIAGDAITVHALMGPGVDPHLYRMKEGDVHLLAAANLVLYNGLHLEGKIADVLKQLPHARVVAVAECLPTDALKLVGPCVYDPHVWHAVQLWKQVIIRIAEVLSEQDSAHQEWYAQRVAAYAQRLDALDAWVHEQVAHIPASQRILVTAHDAFSYFGAAYGMIVVGLQGISTDADIATKDVQALAEYVVTHKIKAIFVESSIAPRTLEAVQYAVTARGWSVTFGGTLYSDALGDAQSGAATYEAMIRHNVNTMVSALAPEVRL